MTTRKAMDFLREMRRRRLPAVAAMYAVVCWGTWEVASVALPALGLPEWTLTLVVVLGGLGFPLALVLGWAYDIEPHGVVRTPGRTGDSQVTSDSADGRESRRWASIEHHLQNLVDEGPESRRQYLDTLQGEAAHLRSEVEALLQAHDDVGPLDDIVERLRRDREPHLLAPGMAVGRYRLVRPLGGGGMGVVFEAIDERIQRRVALKFLAPEISSNEEAKARFLVEARAAATLDHPNVCTILEVGEDAHGSLFLAMPYYVGETLQGRIKRSPLDVGSALRIARQISEGLEAAHRRGIVHRDIKPANLIITEDGVAKIVDFGVAKMADASLTRTGAALGSPSYMSPEQTRGEEVDHRSDLWAVGIVLFEMVAGRRPFLGANEHAIRTSILTDDVPSLASVRADAAPVLDAILQRALHKERDQRYTSASELIAEIDSVLESGAPQSCAPVRPILEPGERRICSIISIRLSSYERLIDELGPDELRSLSQRIDTVVAEVVATNGGVVLSKEGDRHSAAFGIPMTREDDAQRALCAAMEALERLRHIGAELAPELGLPLNCRAGVDSGPVVVRRDPHAAGYDVSGRPLRVAQELARRAAESEVLITSECRRLVADSAEIGSTAKIDVTGEQGLVTAHTLLSASPRRDTLHKLADGQLTPFRGRGEHLAHLSRLARDAAAGTGGVVQIAGEPGVGKSRLVLEFTAGLDPSHFRVLTGRALPVSRSTSYAPIAEILRAVVAGELKNGSEPTADDVVRAMLELGDDLRESIPLLLRLLSLNHPDHPFPTQLSRDHVRVEMVEAVAGVFSLLAERMSVVLVLEDWHWADDASTSALRQLAEVAPSFRILVIVTVRSGYGVDLRRLPGLATISLDPLGPEASSEMLSSVLGADAIEDSLADAIARRTGGNPFYIEEFGTDLLEQGVVRIAAGRAHLADRSEVRLPDSVQAVIRARLDRLDASAKGALFTASVIGRDFSRDLLEQVSSEPDQLDRALAALKTGGLIQQTRVLPESVYRFKHALTLEVTYESLLAHQRRTVHHRVAEALENQPSAGEKRFDVLAHHFASARDWARAMPHGLVAARRSVELSENEDALRMLDRLTEEWAPQLVPSEETDRLLMTALFMKERVLDHTGGREAQQSVIDRLHPLVGSLGGENDRIELELRQGDLFAAIQRHDDAERVLENALRRARGSANPTMQRKALRSLGMVWWRQDSGREAEALELLEEALQLDLTNDDIDAEIGDRANICTLLLAMGQTDRALEMAETIRDRAPSGHVTGSHLANYHLARCHRARGDTELALRFLQEAAALQAPDRNSAFVRSAIASIHLELGEPEKALETYDLIVAEARRHDLSDALSITLRSSADVLTGLGRGSEAIPLLEEAQQLFGSLQDRVTEAAVAIDLAALYCEEGRAQDAVVAWGTVRQLARRIGDPALELQTLEGLAAATRQHFGEDDLSVPLYEEASTLAESLDDAPAAARILNSLGVIAWDRGDLDGARDYYERALVAARSAERHDDVVLILASLGVVHRRAGRLEKAVASIQEAIDESDRPDSNPLLQGYALAVLGDVLMEKQDLAAAERAYSDSLALRRALGDERGECWMLVKLSDVEASRGALDRVRELNGRAYEIATRIDDPELVRASTGRERY